MAKKLPLTDVKLTVLNDHYKDSQRATERSINNRDRSFLLILILLAVMTSQLFSPEQTNSVLGQLIKGKFGIDVGTSISYVGTLIWFGLLATVIRYFQTVISIERQYNYTHELEEELAKEYGRKAFTREGKSYLANYPIFLDWLHFIYRRLFPLLLLTAVTMKIISEIQPNYINSIPLIFDTLIYLILVASIVLYSYSLKKLDEKQSSS